VNRLIASEIENAQEDLSEQIQQLRNACEKLRVAQIDRLDRTEKFIENQRMANDFFKPFISAEQRYQTVRKLDARGSAV